MKSHASSVSDRLGLTNFGIVGLVLVGLAGCGPADHDALLPAPEPASSINTVASTTPRDPSHRVSTMSDGSRVEYQPEPCVPVRPAERDATGTDTSREMSDLVQTPVYRFLFPIRTEASP